MKLIAVRMTKTTLYLTEPELIRLLSAAPDLWAEAVRRGKRIKRAARAREKEGSDPREKRERNN